MIRCTKSRFIWIEFLRRVPIFVSVLLLLISSYGGFFQCFFFKTFFFGNGGKKVGKNLHSWKYGFCGSFLLVMIFFKIFFSLIDLRFMAVHIMMETAHLIPTCELKHHRDESVLSWETRREASLTAIFLKILKFFHWINFYFTILLSSIFPSFSFSLKNFKLKTWILFLFFLFFTIIFIYIYIYFHFIYFYLYYIYFVQYDVCLLQLIPSISPLWFVMFWCDKKDFLFFSPLHPIYHDVACLSRNGQMSELVKEWSLRFHDESRLGSIPSLPNHYYFFSHSMGFILNYLLSIILSIHFFISKGREIL